MKKLLALLTISAILFTGCAKDDETDFRDQFLGTYSGTTIISIPSLDMLETYSGTNTITKNSESDKITFTGSDGSVFTAKVSGNSYVYDKYTETQTMQGETVTIEMTGNGTINGTIITESGSYKIYMVGQEFTGTWTGTMTK